MKKLFTISFACFLVVASLSAQRSITIDEMVPTGNTFQGQNAANKTNAVDTIWTYWLGRDTLFSYGISAPGLGVALGTAFDTTYFTGPMTYYNISGQTAQHYDAFNPSAITVTEVLAAISRKDVVGTSDTVVARVWESGTDSFPSTQVGNGKAAVSSLTSYFPSQAFSSIPINNGTGAVSGAFLISLDYSSLTDDTVGLYANSIYSSDGGGERRIRQYVDYTAIGGSSGWLRSTDFWTFTVGGQPKGLDADVYLIPVISTTGVGVNPIEFKGLTVLGNYPNPTNGVSHIRFSLDKTKNVEVKIFDLTGRILANVSREFAAGENEVLYDFTNEPAGNYYFVLNVEGQTLTSRINVAK